MTYHSIIRSFRMETILAPWLVCLALLAAFSNGRSAYANALEEYQLKAAFIYNFAKFVEWPSGAFTSADAPIVLSILGDNPFGSATESIENKPVGRRNLRVRFIKKAEEVDGSHIVFVCASEKERLEQILNSLKGKPVMTVSDMERFTQRRGMIGFVFEDSKVRFQVNLSAARLAGLEISSKLLKLAQKVTEDQ